MLEEKILITNIDADEYKDLIKKLFFFYKKNLFFIRDSFSLFVMGLSIQSQDRHYATYK